MTFEMWWMLAVVVGVLGMVMYECYAAGYRAGQVDMKREARQATFAALRGAVDDSMTEGERAVAWKVARFALEPDES